MPQENEDDKVGPHVTAGLRDDTRASLRKIKEAQVSWHLIKQIPTHLPGTTPEDFNYITSYKFLSILIASSVDMACSRHLDGVFLYHENRLGYSPHIVKRYMVQRHLEVKMCSSENSESWKALWSFLVLLVDSISISDPLRCLLMQTGSKVVNKCKLAGGNSTTKFKKAKSKVKVNVKMEPHYCHLQLSLEAIIAWL